MNIERLTMLQTLITTVSDGKWYGGEPFAYNNFMYCMFKVKWPKKTNISFNLEFWCSNRKRGYSACAMGHAMLDKNFNALGLGHTDNLMVPVFNGLMGYDAVSAFFEIDMETTKILFCPDSYSSDCWKDPIWFLLRLDWLIHNAHGDEVRFKEDYTILGETL